MTCCASARLEPLPLPLEPAVEVGLVEAEVKVEVKAGAEATEAAADVLVPAALVETATEVLEEEELELVGATVLVVVGVQLVELVVGS